MNHEAEPGNVLLDQTLESALRKHPEFPHHTLSTTQSTLGQPRDQVGVTSILLPLGDSTEYGVQWTQLSIYCPVGRKTDWTTGMLNDQKTMLTIRTFFSNLVVSQNHAIWTPSYPSDSS